MTDDFGTRCKGLIEAQRGKPFQKGEIDYDWNERGNFTRKYAHSVTAYAMQALHLDEGVADANAELRDLCQHYLDHETDLYEAHSFHWSGALYNRLWAFFGPTGSAAAGRLEGETQALMRQMMFAWSKKASPVLDPSTDHIGRFSNSENHHAMGIVTTWGFCGVLKDDDEHKDRTFDDGRTAAEHYAAWNAYLKAYFRSRAGKGQSVEIASKSYNAHTIQMWYNAYDFAEDEDLKRVAGQYLDLYWATWAEEQIDGVRGGGKTRIYQGPASLTAAGGAVEEMAGLYLGTRDDEKMGTTDWIVCTSGYDWPELVYQLARDVEGRGAYEVVQRCLGLQEPGWERVPDPPVIPFGINGLREDFGGFLRYSYCTPDFVMGTLMCEARPHSDWTGVAAQNRWQGVMFRGHPDAAIVPECTAVDTHLNLNNHQNTMNQHWSVQRKGSLITQKLKNPDYSTQTGDSKVWISAKGLSDPIEKDGWIFVASEGAYAAVHVVAGYKLEDSGEGGWWGVCEQDLSPIVIEVGRQSDHVSQEAFQSAVGATEVSFDDHVLNYVGLSGDRFTFHADYSALPSINGETINLAPNRVYDSPFVQSQWDSGVVEIAFGGESQTVDFNV